MERLFGDVQLRVQRNGITDRVNVELGEELDVEDADSIEVISIKADLRE
jgi:hypothetical protein